MTGRRIAIVSHAHPSVSSGGAEISAYTLFLGLRELGEDVIFVSMCKEGDLDRATLGDPEREHLVSFTEDEHDWFYHVSKGRISGEIARVLDDFAPAIINFHHFIFLGVQTILSAARRESTKVFITLHEFLALCQSDGQMVTRPNRRLCSQAVPQKCVLCWPEYDVYQFASRRDSMREMLDSVTGLISPSAFLRQRFVEWGLDGTRIAVIENGLRRVPSESTPGHAREDRPWRFGYFGQINPYKGVEVLLAAAELQAASASPGAGRVVVRVHGNMVGQTPAFVERMEQAVAAGVIEYAGPYPNEQVSELMAACDYIVVPSMWWENSPVVIQEAFACGRPVIVSGIGGMAEKVADGVTGFHFATGNAADLLRVLARAADRDLYAALCSALPASQSAIVMARDYLEYFESAGSDASLIEHALATVEI